MGQSEDGQRTWPGWGPSWVRRPGSRTWTSCSCLSWLVGRGDKSPTTSFSEVWLRAWRSRTATTRAPAGCGHGSSGSPAIACEPISGSAADNVAPILRVAVRSLGRRRRPVGRRSARSGLGAGPPGALARNTREILLLVAWEQLSPAEIAQSLQMHPGTVRSRLHRARRALQEYLHAELEVRLESDPQEVC